MNEVLLRLPGRVPPLVFAWIEPLTAKKALLVLYLGP